MKISHVSVRNYRSLERLELPVSDYTALIGANGAGKSSVLYALEWFFSGQGLDVSDVHGQSSTSEPSAETQTEEGIPASAVSITVTFSELSAADRVRLSEYGRGETATFTRTWAVGDAKSKVVGNALAGPGFAAIRQISTVGELRKGYARLRDEGLELPELGSSPKKDEIFQALADWESNPANKSLLESIDSTDANHMFGINGSNVIRECVRLVLVPAATDISSQVGETGKGSALTELIGTVMASAGAAARSEWLTKYEAEIRELSDAVRVSVEKSTEFQAQRINNRLSSLVPNARISFDPTVPNWAPKSEPAVATTVSIDGVVNDVSRQGHGVQRAVMIAMFQSLAPDAALMHEEHTILEGETEEDASRRLQSELEKLPFLVICIEEPEIYQHPIRARAFARVLSGLAEQANVQIIFATHSPYFVRPDQFESLRRFTLSEGKTGVSGTTLAKLAASASCTEVQARKIVEKRLPTTFAEGFFADAVVLVEGDTDKILLETLADRLGSPLDALGISVVSMEGKESIKIPFALLAVELGIPTYVIVDGDALGAKRAYPDNSEAENKARASHKGATDKVCEWLPTGSATAMIGALPFEFGDPTLVTDRFTIWNDDIEQELSAWPSFMASLATNGVELRSKNVLNNRTAALEADLTDMPAMLGDVIKAVLGFRGA
ncbi:ATP-dependent nuclease [Paenarthrobacter nicotinovorans]|uniref:ATP-dependent nuclease n=1 Tax=Paenarthrobacter nicotinovorans TaxID=29320 RepID=UPI0038277E0D